MVIKGNLSPWCPSGVPLVQLLEVNSIKVSPLSPLLLRVDEFIEVGKSKNVDMTVFVPKIMLLLIYRGVK